MKISSAQFVTSADGIETCPEAESPEFAFIGRSNVGKSSLLNMLVGRKGLAKVSATPGATQLLNFFAINDSWTLVDLPGYGYSKTPKTVREGFRQAVSDYLTQRENMQFVFVLIDSRLTPQAIDLEFCAWLAEVGIPFVVAFTKTDKSKAGKVRANVEAFLEAVTGRIGAEPRHFLTSATKGTGRGEVLGFIDDVLRA